MIPFINLKNIQSKLVPYDDVGARGSHLPLLKVEVGANVTLRKCVAGAIVSEPRKDLFQLR
jgi:hypothetical protein